MKIIVRMGLLLVAAASLSGCAGIGVFASSDPEVKISDAKHLLSHSNRPLIAERLIREAAVICENNKSQECLASTYNAYGWFFESQAVESWKKVYTRDGFLHPSATYETRYSLALEYFKKAEAIQVLGVEYDNLTNTYLGMGTVYHNHLGDSESACEAFDKSLVANQRNVKSNPEATVQVGDNYSSFGEVIVSMKKYANCEK